MPPGLWFVSLVLCNVLWSCDPGIKIDGGLIGSGLKGWIGSIGADALVDLILKSGLI